MPTPTASVSIALLSGTSDMILDDGVRGVLDSDTFVLGPTVTLATVTGDVRSVGIRRGRQRQLERFQAGQCTIVLNNDQRTYDPSVTSSVISPYAGEIRPRREVRVDAGGVRLFTGIVEDWNLTYETKGDATAEVVCVDRLNLLAEQSLSGSAMVTERTDQRITKVLSAPEVDWPLNLRDLDTGNATVGTASVTANANALQYLQRVEEAEGGGGLFIGPSGSLTFRNRSVTQSAVGAPTFSDTGAGSVIPFMDIDIEYGTEAIFNQVNVTLEQTGQRVTSDDVSSQTEFGVTARDTNDSLLSSSQQAADFGAYFTSVYGQPVFRVNGLSVDLGAISASHQQTILGLDLLDVALVSFTPGGIGSPVNQTLTVDRIEHTLTPRRHVVRFGFSQTLGAFVLDSSEYGVLDDDRLGF